MKIAAISDLHIGSSAEVDQFGHRDDDFLHFLDHLEARFDHIILNGDIYQTDHGRKPWGRAQEFWNARERHWRLSERFRLKPYHYIAGNHDHIAVEIMDIPEVVFWRVDDVRICFTHGHLHDPWIRRNPGISQLGSWTNGWIERLGFQKTALALEWLDKQKHMTTQISRVGSILHAAEEVLQRVDVVVMGHTHIPAVIRTPSGHYLNSGSCSRGAFQWLDIDTERRQYLVHQGKVHPPS